MIEIAEKSMNTLFDCSPAGNKGNIMNLIQVDIQKIMYQGPLVLLSVSSVFNGIGCIIIGFSLLGGIFGIYMLFTLFFITIIGFTYKYKLLTEYNMYKMRDKRMSMLSNSIENIRYVKFNVYEEFFCKLMHKMRRNELKCISVIAIFFSVGHFLNFFGT